MMMTRDYGSTSSFQVAKSRKITAISTIIIIIVIIIKVQALCQNVDVYNCILVCRPTLVKWGALGHSHWSALGRCPNAPDAYINTLICSLQYLN